MHTNLLDYELPKELIAQYPSPVRSDSRLLVMMRSDKHLFDRHFADITEYLRAGDCLVLNDTKVLPARFFAQRQVEAQGRQTSLPAALPARLEGLFIEQTSPGNWIVMLKNSRRIKPGEILTLLDKTASPFTTALAAENLGTGRWRLQLRTSPHPAGILAHIGFAPLPPYIKRPQPPTDAQTDIQRYQTVYAQKSGAIAAPTAGLHFTSRLLDNIRHHGVTIARLTLHTGAGTFKPVTTDNLEDHHIHSEQFSIDGRNARIINRTKQRGARVIAVGTTSVRALETTAQNGSIVPSTGSTSLFITPGYRFKIVDAMITNFHLPRSTLLALVAAFAGLEDIKKAYRHAIENRYRFYSYGDAMFII